MTQFTANEVRELAATIWPDSSGREEVTEALNAFAYLLEAREKAVPVAYALFTEKRLIRMWSREWFADAHGAPVNPTPLYVHPTPSDADRLAEALRWIMRTAGDAKEPCGGDPESPAAIRNGVLASISQAAAQSLGIVQGPSLAARTPWTEGEKAHFKAAAELVAQREAAQAQPPAASVTDAMVERAQDCLHDKGKDIGHYHMRAALEAALAAQENPNG